jgi:alpha-tubulin suppressor-like RCC1 family protein
MVVSSPHQSNLPPPKISAGSTHCLALTKQGEVYAWGRGANGRTGQGTKSSLFLPRRIKGLKKIKYLSCGWSHSFCLDLEGVVYAFGRGESGQLGLSSPVDAGVPMAIPSSRFGGEPVKEVKGGFLHSAAVTESGRLFLWGCGIHGQLGFFFFFLDLLLN